jgi:TonB-like protein
MPETLNSDRGSTAIPGQQEHVAAQRARRARKKRLPPPPRSRNAGDLLGLGALGTTENGVNLNLTPQNALAAVGRDRLRKELQADAERRRSAHRGSWKTLGIERWRSAIENYVPSVKPGNQTALNTARVPFASYLNTIHNRLHPIFADSFLASLDSLPGSHPMNRPQISTNLEIVLDQAEGRIVRMGITKTSGVTAFDIAALESVNRAQPFGPPPREIVSPDGNVYFQWEFWREPYYACSTYFARPYILKVKPKSAPPTIEPPPSRPHDPDEAPGGDEHGAIPKPRLEIHAAVR